VWISSGRPQIEQEDVMTATTTTPKVPTLEVRTETPQVAVQTTTPTVAPISTVRPARTVRIIGRVVLAAGLLMSTAGAATWVTVQSQLADEKITVAEDAGHFAGQAVNGPFTAYSQAQIIEKHALEASKGKTYAELDREDPVRATVMNGSFLRASLFTSVVSFGVAAMAFGLGLIIALLGFALLAVARSLTPTPRLRS
jgi:hypothetical protein